MNKIMVTHLVMLLFGDKGDGDKFHEFNSGVKFLNFFVLVISVQ